MCVGSEFAYFVIFCATQVLSSTYVGPAVKYFFSDCRRGDNPIECPDGACWVPGTPKKEKKRNFFQFIPPAIRYFGVSLQNICSCGFFVEEPP